MNKTVIIVAGGIGLRMNSETPKQFLEIAGKPILMHTILKFFHFDQKINIVLVLPFDHIATWNMLCSQHRFTIPHQIETGGSERFYSVKKGLQHAMPGGLAAIHDGVRPLVPEQLIKESFEAAAKFGSAIPVIPPAESLRKTEGESSYPVDRDLFRLVQTPQTFKTDLITEAYERPFKPEFTDDATVFEAAGNTIHLIPGAPENIKITRPADLIFAKAILHQQTGAQTKC